MKQYKKYEEPDLYITAYELLDVILASDHDPFEDDWFND